MEQLEKIEQYLMGRLSGEALREFETEMQRDPALAKGVQAYREAIGGIEAAGTREFEQQLQAWEAAIRKEEARTGGGGNIRPLWQRYMAAAAMVLALLALTYLLWPGQGAATDPEALFAAHFQPMDDYLTLKGEARPEDSAMALYQEGRYNEALPYFEKAFRGDSLPSLIHLYAAISYLAGGQPGEARLLLEPLATAPSSYTEPAEWYLALAELREGNPEGARQRLMAILDKPNHSYALQARKLIKELEDN